MSWQAQNAIDQLPYDACGALPYRVLQKLANVAAEDGSRAFRHAGAMASELGVSQRSVQRALQDLEAGGLIRRGDQRYVSHIRGDRRPVVYDVVMRYGDASAIHPLPVDNYAEDGTTELSTVEHDTTSGTTTVVAHIEQQELLNTTTPSNHRAAVVPSPLCTAVRGPHQFHGGRYCAACLMREDGAMPNANGVYPIEAIA